MRANFDTSVAPRLTCVKLTATFRGDLRDVLDATRDFLRCLTLLLDRVDSPPRRPA
jgi:hypothetical protein